MSFNVELVNNVFLSSVIWLPDAWRFYLSEDRIFWELFKIFLVSDLVLIDFFTILGFTAIYLLFKIRGFYWICYPLIIKSTSLGTLATLLLWWTNLLDAIESSFISASTIWMIPILKLFYIFLRLSKVRSLDPSNLVLNVVCS